MLMIAEPDTRAKTQTSTGPLTEAQVQEYHDRGFLVIGNPQISPKELEWCKNILLGLINGNTGRAEGRNIDLCLKDENDDNALSSPQILQPSLYATELRNLSFRQTALALAKQLLGPSVVFIGDHAILKPSLHGGSTPWHQDEGFRDPNFDYKELSIWIAITPSTADNGALKYIPGSHRLGMLRHRLPGGSDEGNFIECHEGFNQDDAVVCPIPAGAMIVHDGRTIHGASGNMTKYPRLAYIIQYATPPVPTTKFREFPWLKNLRKSLLKKRTRSLALGGIVPELLRILRSDRYSHQHFITGFARRRINQVRNWFRE